MVWFMLPLNLKMVTLRLNTEYRECVQKNLKMVTLRLNTEYRECVQKNLKMVTPPEHGV
jgi:hypothetical protein